MSNNVPNTGAASFADVRTAFGGSGAISIADSEPRLMANISSGAISMNDLRGTFHATTGRTQFMSQIYYLYNGEYVDHGDVVDFSAQPDAVDYALINGKNVFGCQGNPADKFSSAAFSITVEGTADWTYLNLGGNIYYRSNGTTTQNSGSSVTNYSGNAVLGFPTGSSIVCYGG